MEINSPGATPGFELAALTIPAELVVGPERAAMVKGRAFDVAPSAGTVTLAVPAAARSAAGTRAVTCDALTKVVASGVPFQATVAPDGRLLPLTVRVRSAPPTDAEAGLRLVMAAGGVDAFTVNTGA